MWCTVIRRMVWLSVLAVSCVLSSGLIAGKRNPQTGMPYTDAELLEIMMNKEDDSCPGRNLFDRIGFLEATELFFTDLGGVADIVISAYDNDFRLVVLNYPEKMNLNNLKGTYSISIHPLYREALMTGSFARHGIHANDEGIIDEVIAVNDFYKKGVAHYTVSLAYDHGVKASVEIRRFHLVIAAISRDRNRDFLADQMKDDRSLDSIGLLPTKEDAWRAGRALKEHVDNMLKSILVLDMADLDEVSIGLLPKKAFHFLQENRFQAESAGFCLVVIPENLELARGQVPGSCIVTSISRYKSVFAQLVIGLQSDDWEVVHKMYAEFTDMPELDTFYPEFVFSKLYLEENTVRYYAPPLFVEPQYAQHVEFHKSGGFHPDQAQLYITPMILNQGFHFASGEYTKVRVHEGWFSLPFPIKNMPVQSWHYL